MTLLLKVRCTTCDQSFQDVPTSVCSVCGSNTWEPCVIETDPQDVSPIFLHHSGVAFFAYGETDASPPDWAEAIIPAGSRFKNRTSLEEKLDADIIAMGVIAAESNATINQNPAQRIKDIAKMMRRLGKLQRNDLTTGE